MKVTKLLLISSLCNGLKCATDMLFRASRRGFFEALSAACRHKNMLFMSDHGGGYHLPCSHTSFCLRDLH